MKKRMLPILITLIFLMSGSVLSQPREYPPCDNKEPRYFLGPGDGEWSFSEEMKRKPVYLHEEPEDKSKVKVVSRDVYHSWDFLANFNVNKDPKGYAISSTEKRREFYKVCYQGKSYWVRVEDFTKVYTPKEYFSHMSYLSFRFEDKVEFYLEVGGEIYPWEKFVKKLKDSEKSRDLDIGATFVDVKIVNSKMWVKVMFQDGDKEGFPVRPEKKDFEDFYLWFRPYQDNGQVTSWIYGHKDLSF